MNLISDFKYPDFQDELNDSLIDVHQAISNDRNSHLFTLYNALSIFPFLTDDSTKIILELGSWVGHSTKFLVKSCPDAVVIAVDTWKGSHEHYRKNSKISKKIIDNLYGSFLINCHDYKDKIIPMRMKTSKAIKILHDYGVSPDLVIIDADHSYNSVKKDLEDCLRCFPNARIVGDDYCWTSVKTAVKDVMKTHDKIESVISFGDDAHSCFVLNLRNQKKIDHKEMLEKFPIMGQSLYDIIELKDGEHTLALGIGTTKSKQIVSVVVNVMNGKTLRLLPKIENYEMN